MISLYVCNIPATSFQNVSANEIRDKSNFNIDISLEKNVYLENEYILLNFNIKNESDKIDSLRNFYDIEMHPLFVLKKGELRLDFRGMVDGIAKNSYVLFKPGEERRYEFMLNNSFGDAKQEAYNDSKRFYLPEGNYTVSFYSDKAIFGYNLNSNTLTFDVIRPSGSNSDALNELREIYKVEPSTDLSLMYRYFVYKYPESPYMDQAFELYLSIRLGPYEYHYADLIIGDCKWFIERKPNSTSTALVLNNCVELIETYYNESDGIEYLNMVYRNYNNLKAGLEAKRLLNKIER